MTPTQLRAELDRVLADRQLLRHPFYRRWEEGRLDPAELAAYAGQYLHFETALPGMLRRLLADIDGDAADLIRRNLADEEANPMPHVELFGAFAQAVGATPDAPPTPATRLLLDTYSDLIAAGGAEGIAGLVAYEIQAPAVAASKADGLRRHYGLDARATHFWDLHATIDENHADWAVEALAAMDAEPVAVVSAARRAADAWWAFLDERESEAIVVTA